MLPTPIRTYLIHGLAASPLTLDTLLKDAPASRYDFTPDPARFTLREVMTHLADWDVIWLERIQAMVEQDNPALPDYDEGAMAVERDYAHADFGAQQSKFREGRARLVAYLRELTPEQWERPGQRDWGGITVGTQAAMILGHDGYHTRQIIEWLQA